MRRFRKAPRKGWKPAPPEVRIGRAVEDGARSARSRGLLFLWILLAADPMTWALQLPSAPPEEAGMSGARLDQLERVMEAAIREGETPGAVVLVGRRGRIVYRKAFGKRALEPRPEPMTVDTVFDVASMTKVMATATSVLILVEEGRIALTDRVARYLPAFAENEKDGVTVLQLLTHFSGLRPDLDLDEPWTGYRTGVGKALEERLVAVPGSEFIYSDINYIVLAEIVRVVSGQDLQDFSSRRIFEPLGLKRTRFLPPSEWISDTAPTEYRDGELLRGVVHDPTAFRMGGATGHAGLFSTADDTAVFAQMILNGGVLDRVRILSPLSVLKMTSSQSPPGSLNKRGIGFDIDTPFSGSRGDLFPSGSFGHTGFTGTSFWMDPMTESFVLLFTARVHPHGEGNVVSLRKRVASVVASSVLDLSPGGQSHGVR